MGALRRQGTPKDALHDGLGQRSIVNTKRLRSSSSITAYLQSILKTQLKGYVKVLSENP